MDTLLITIAVILGVAGVAGSILPAFPGTPLNFGALFFLYFIDRGTDPSLWVILAFGLLTALSFVADYVIPAHSVRRYGATRLGVIGAILGMIIGFVVLNIVGLLAGTFLGATQSLSRALIAKLTPSEIKTEFF